MGVGPACQTLHPLAFPSGSWATFPTCGTVPYRGASQTSCGLSIVALTTHSSCLSLCLLPLLELWTTWVKRPHLSHWYVFRTEPGRTEINDHSFVTSGICVTDTLWTQRDRERAVYSHGSLPWKKTYSVNQNRDL